MNFMSVFSLILGIVILISGMKMASEDLMVFFDKASIFIVLGGTFSSGAIAFKIGQVFRLFKVYVQRFVMGKTVKDSTIVMQCVEIAKQIKQGNSYKSQIDKSDDLFLNEGLEMLEEGTVDTDQLVDIMEIRNDNIFKHYVQDARDLKAIAVFAPAFGMIGTTIGMIVLLSNLSASEDAMKIIGPAMSVALITTLYGSIVANLLLVPIGENLEKYAKELHSTNIIKIKALEMLSYKENPVIVAQMLNSYLLPKNRIDWKKGAA